MFKTHIKKLSNFFFVKDIVSLNLIFFSIDGVKGATNLEPHFVTSIHIDGLISIVLILISIAYYTVAERKILASIQRRMGPNVVGVFGLLQPLADGAKLMIKEILLPTRANKLLFIIAPCMFLILSFTCWSIIPFNTMQNPDIFWLFDYINNCYKCNMPPKLMINSVANITYSILFLLAISSLNVYPIIFGGWASNSKYAFLGCLRSAAQMISYEVSIGLVLLPIVMFTGSLNLAHIVIWQQHLGWFFLPLLMNSVIFFVSILAETNRAPFDLPEAEGELVAGYNVEYAAIIFAMFFLAEYGNMILMSTVITLLFFGGWLPYGLSLKILIFCYLFVLMRAAYPRYRYDQLMDIGWKIFLPISLSMCILISGLVSSIATY